MNIFEALKIGMGKATLPGYIDYVSYTDKDGISWSCRPPIISTVRDSQIKRDDWIPYVPPEERKIEGQVNFNYNSVLGYVVPRGTCPSCGQALPPKTKHKEVFEDVRWIAWPRNQPDYVIYPNIGSDIKHTFIKKPLMKMTLEWEE